jgi:hypothetical protein
MAEKKDERTLEMRIAELENRLGGGAQQQMEFTEQEVAAYNKIADALGVGVGPEQHGACRWQPPPACRVQACRIQSCRIQPCRIQPCRVQVCRVINSCRPNQPGPISQCISQCISECFACYAGDYEVDLSGGFGTLGY